jgi:hypothetical protein
MGYFHLAGFGGLPEEAASIIKLGASTNLPISTNGNLPSINARPRIAITKQRW